MPIEGLPPVVANTHMLASVSDWGARLVSPLGSSLMSKDGMLELAGRVYLIVGLMLTAAIVLVVKNGYLTGRITPPNSSSTNLSGDDTKPFEKNLQTSSETDKSREVFKKETGNSMAPTGPSSTNPEVSSNVSAGNSSIVSGVAINDANSTVNLGNTNPNS